MKNVRIAGQKVKGELPMAEIIEIGIGFLALVVLSCILASAFDGHGPRWL